MFTLLSVRPASPIGKNVEPPTTIVRPSHRRVKDESRPETTGHRPAGDAGILRSCGPLAAPVVDCGRLFVDSPGEDV
jgi:hypothetical protein